MNDRPCFAGLRAVDVVGSGRLWLGMVSSVGVGQPLPAKRCHLTGETRRHALGLTNMTLVF